MFRRAVEFAMFRRGRRIARKDVRVASSPGIPALEARRILAERAAHLT